MILAVWIVFGLVFAFLLICMLRNMFFTMLDKRAEEEYDKALDEGKPVWFEDHYPTPVATSMAPAAPAPAHVALHVGEGRVVSAGNYGRRGPLYQKLVFAACASEPYPYDSSGLNYSTEERFYEEEDQI